MHQRVSSRIPVFAVRSIQGLGETAEGDAGGDRDVPQRLHSVCVLLWRLPKLEVPLVILLGYCAGISGCDGQDCEGGGRTVGAVG